LICALNFFIKKEASAQEYSFVPYSVKDGLAQTQVYTISSDDDGFLWFGTAGGASKFDGVSFQNYSTANGLTGNVVVSIKQFKSYLWIFSKNGVTRIKGREIKKYDLSDNIKGEFINLAFYNDLNNSIWISVRNIGIIEIPLSKSDEPDLTKTKEIQLPSEDAINPRTLLFDGNSKIYLGSNGYLGYFEFGKWTNVSLPNSAYNISDIKFNRQNELIISVYDEGVYIKKGASIKQYTTNEGIASMLIRNIFIDSKDRIWLSSKNGITLINKNEVSLFKASNGLPNENIEVIYEDKEGNIWFGTDGSGAFRYTSDEFVTYNISTGLNSNYVMSIVQDSLNKYWFSTYGNGINTLNEKEITYWNTENNTLTNNIVWTSIKDAQNNLWFGTSEGLVKIDKNSTTTFVDEWWLPSNKITSLYQDKKEYLYVGTSKGLALRKNGVWKKYDDSLGLNLKNIRSIEEGYGKKMWLGTSNGVYVFDENYCEPWINNDLLEDKVVYCIKNFKDSLWFIGTANGLYKSDGNNCEKITFHPSFSANFINFIGIESNRYLWVGTNYGIFEIDIQRYFVQKKTQTIKHHTENSGITSVETNLNSFYQDSENHLWMGTGNGLIKFDRAKRKDSVDIIVPKTYISDIQLFLKPTNWSNYSNDVSSFTGLPNSLILPSRVNYLTFYFSSICFSNPKEVKYRLKLEGLDEDWTPVIDQHSFTYPNLSYGEYTFKVISSLDGINWSEPAVFKFEILKPYYLTWWFFTINFLLLASIVFGIIKWRQNVVKRQRITEQLMYKSKLLSLEQQTLNASMNRHFIFNALNSIQYYINTQDRLSANKYLTSFAKLIRKNLDSSIANNGMVTLTDELERLELYVSLEMMRFQEKFKYELEVHPSIKTDDILIPSMILQPFVENSIWHGILPKGTEGKISISIYSEDGYTVFEIEDNGIGIDFSLKNKTLNDHHSQGMLITSGRIDILKKVNEQKMFIEGPFQMNDEAGNITGTKVIIKLENQKM
jgi:ligand-binding sensor domain-containing protein